MLRNQRGAVSLIAVTFASLLIMILTIGMSQLMIGAMRHSIDAENNIDAYFTAESLAERQLAAMKIALNNGDNPYATPSVFNGSCGPRCTTRTIGQTYRTSVNDQGSVQLLLPSGTRSVAVEWEPINPGPLIGNSLLEVSVAQFSKTPSNTIDPNQTKILSQYWCTPGFPACNGASPSGVDYASITATSTDVFNQPAGANMNYLRNNNGKAWKLEARDVSTGGRTALRLKPYTGSGQTIVKVSAYSSPNATGSPLSIEFPTAIVDVTGNVTESYSRVVKQLPIQNLEFPGDGYVIFGDETICKDFETVEVTPGQPFRIRPGVCSGS